MNESAARLQHLTATIEQSSLADLASESWKTKVTYEKREAHSLLTTSERISKLDNAVKKVKTMFNPKPLLEEISRFGLVTVGDSIKNPTVYCFGASNVLYKYNLGT
jgi:hypothetical protein